MTIFPLSQHKGLNIDRKWEESKKSTETKKVYVATRSFMMILTLGRIYRDKEAPVTTNEIGRKQNFCRDKGTSVTIVIIATWKSLLRQKKNFKEIPLSQQGNVCRDTERRSIRRDKMMYVETLKEEETLIAIYKQCRDM